MPNQDAIDTDEHDRRRALGILPGTILPTTEHPIEGQGGNPQAQRPDYKPGVQKGSGSQ